MSDWPSGLTLRPIERWPQGLTTRRRRSNFSSTLSATLSKLTGELGQIGAKGVVLQIALDESQFRIDGLPRAHAKPEHPGVVLSFTTADGSLSFPCDTYDRWQDNLRAIVVTLEDLRRIARHGVTKHGEQYAGWRAIESAEARYERPASEEEALATIRAYAEPGAFESLSLAGAVRSALRNTHPDGQGIRSASAFSKVTAAEAYLREHDRL